MFKKLLILSICLFAFSGFKLKDEGAQVNPNPQELNCVGNVIACAGGGFTSTVTVTEAGIESVVDLQDLQGAVTDGQVPNTITIDSSNAVEGTDLGTLTDGKACTYDLAGTEIDCNSDYQPLEATLTDIADGTIAEDLVNTANPWADNEVADNITAGNVEGTDLGTLTDTKYCTYDAANTEIDCDSTPAGSGDVESVGDCTGGACNDGTSDGGTYIRLYDGDSNYGALVTANLTGNRTYTFPNFDGTVATLAGTETLTGKTLNSADNVIHADDSVNVVDADFGDVTVSSGAWAVENDSHDHATSITGKSANVSDADFGDVSVSSGAWSVEDDSHAHGSSTISGLVNADLSGSAGITQANLATTAGRSLTFSTNDWVADAETYTDSKTLYFENPTASDDFKTIWTTQIPATITAISCESDQTVNFDLQVDDGTPTGVNGSDIACTTYATDSSLAGDTTVAAGDRIDLAITSVSGTPTWVSITFHFTYDD